MTTKKNVVDALTVVARKKAGGKMASAIPGAALIEGLERIHAAHSDYHKLREQERTKRVAIIAQKDVSIEKIRAQRDVIKQALSDAFALRKTGLQAQIRAMDKAIDNNDAQALHIILDSMVKTIQSSPFKSIEEMKEKLSDKDFVLRLE